MTQRRGAVLPGELALPAPDLPAIQRGERRRLARTTITHRTAPRTNTPPTLLDGLFSAYAIGGIAPILAGTLTLAITGGLWFALPLARRAREQHLRRPGVLSE